MPSDVEWMAKALLEAETAGKNGEVPVGAIVVFDNRIIGSAGNERETLQSPLAHAECLALQRASSVIGSWRLIDCTLYVTLEPCPMCLAAAQQARISRIVYGAPDLKGGALSLGYLLHSDARTNHRFSVEQIDCPESVELLQTFFRSRRKNAREPKTD